MINGPAVSTTFQWDREKMLTKMTKPGTIGPLGTSIAISFRYDALGRRIRREKVTTVTAIPPLLPAQNTVTTETERYVYDGQDVIQDQNANGVATASYLNGPGTDNKLRVQNSGGVNYFLTDHLGSTSGLVNAAGTQTASNIYDGFGNPTNASFPTRYQFTGREYESDFGIQYNRARWYNPALGRFISEDPIGFGGRDSNLYAYVQNDPLWFKDPSGLQRADRDRPGDFYPGMREPYKPGRADLVRDIACPLDGFNPWITVEAGGGLQFGPLGGSDAIGIGFNPLTMELAGQTKLMSGNGGTVGILATAGLQLGLSLGPVASNPNPSTAAEVFGDASAFGGGSGSLNYDGNFGFGSGVGPVVGGGAAGGLRIGEVSPLFSFNRPTCSCKR